MERSVDFVISRGVARLFYCSVISVLIFVTMSGVMGDGSIFQNDEQGYRLSVANTKFALDLYKRQTSAKDKNIFMSPLSISVALAMTYLGAGGQTELQMRNVLHFSDMEEDHLHQTFADIQSALNKPEQAYKLYMANRLFGEKSYTFLDQFLAACQKYYGAELKAVDFRGDSDGAVAMINSWVAEKTNNKITEIVSEDAVNALTRLILVNAVYFKGSWLRQFDVNSTKDEDFHISPNESVKVKMMHSKAKFYYGENSELNCQALELPYTGETLSMFILLPDRLTSSISELEEKLTFDDLVNVKEKFQMSSSFKVNLWLPRFSLDEKLSLSGVLARMGMPDLFSEDVADLSGVDGSKNLYVSDVFHRAVVEVNEEGTEAAAATAVVMMMRSAMIDKEFSFRADHPFLFFIQEKATKSILFLGRLVKPHSAQSTKQEL